MIPRTAGAAASQPGAYVPAAKKLPTNVPTDLRLVEDRYRFTCPVCNTQSSAGITSVGGNVECDKCGQKVLLQKD